MSTEAQADAIRQLHAQFETARALGESDSLETAAPRILRALGEILGCDHGAVWMVDPAQAAIHCLETWHPPSVSLPEFDDLTRRTPFALGIGLPGRVWLSGRPAWIEDVTRDTNFPRAAAAAREGLHGAFGFPIVLGGSVLGMLEFFSRDIREPDQGLLTCSRPWAARSGSSSRGSAPRASCGLSSRCRATCCASRASTATSAG